MRLLARHDHTLVLLTFDNYPGEPIPYRIAHLRGALAAVFHQNDLFHQHNRQGGFLYRYPRIQYGWKDNCGLLSGWNEAAGLLREVHWLDLHLEAAGKPVSIVDATIFISEAEFGLSHKLERYTFATPLLPFSQTTYPRYRQMNHAAKSSERDRLLVAQLLTALRGLRVEFPERLYAAFHDVSMVRCHYKDQNLLGIRGNFVSNAFLPTGFAIGHAVSHGFGRIVSHVEVARCDEF